jgi:quinol monooxygenase YgiN
VLDSNASAVTVISRFTVPAGSAESFARDARAAIAVLAERPGFIDAELGQSTDESELRVIITRWEGVGAYRKALSHYDVKMSAIPFLSLAIDEPSAFEIVHARTPAGESNSVSGLVADAGLIGLGSASGPDIDPVRT